MEVIEWSRLIAPLLPGLHSPSVSKLPSADCQPPSTLSGHSFNPLENRLRQKNTKIYLPTPFYGIKFCSSEFGLFFDMVTIFYILYVYYTNQKSFLWNTYQHTF